MAAKLDGNIKRRAALLSGSGSIYHSKSLHKKYSLMSCSTSVSIASLQSYGTERDKYHGKKLRSAALFSGFGNRYHSTSYLGRPVSLCF
uniref:Uncharacterized protein n=1 Tax=Babesia bovis TaxID=5865 RepID=S6BH61_BABBO|nr:hypothetical protein [Babesia bovis]